MFNKWDTFKISSDDAQCLRLCILYGYVCTGYDAPTPKTFENENNSVAQCAQALLLMACLHWASFNSSAALLMLFIQAKFCIDAKIPQWLCLFVEAYVEEDGIENLINVRPALIKLTHRNAGVLTIMLMILYQLLCLFISTNLRSVPFVEIVCA